MERKDVTHHSWPRGTRYLAEEGAKNKGQGIASHTEFSVQNYLVSKMLQQIMIKVNSVLKWKDLTMALSYQIFCVTKCEQVKISYDKLSDLYETCIIHCAVLGGKV